jgi:hypothetical protein
MEKSLSIIEIKQEIAKQVSDQNTLNTLLETTFKGLNGDLAKRALLEGMMRGFSITDFLQKNIYAIPFKDKKTDTLGYSLVNSVDYARKIGMRSGVVGKSAPTYEQKENGEIISCTVTVKRKVGDYIGDYTATVFFKEYNTGYQQWASKPHTMIAKVAEMHALRMACPEELSQSYLEEEYEQDTVKIELEQENKAKALEEHRAKLLECKDMENLKIVWASLPAESKTALNSIKEELKLKYENPTV